MRGWLACVQLSLETGGRGSALCARVIIEPPVPAVAANHCLSAADTHSLLMGALTCCDQSTALEPALLHLNLHIWTVDS